MPEIAPVAASGGGGGGGLSKAVIAAIAAAAAALVCLVASLMCFRMIYRGRVRFPRFILRRHSDVVEISQVRVVHPRGDHRGHASDDAIEKPLAASPPTSPRARVAPVLQTSTSRRQVQRERALARARGRYGPGMSPPSGDDDRCGYASPPSRALVTPPPQPSPAGDDDDDYERLWLRT